MAIVEALGLREGDHVDIRIVGKRAVEIERDKGRDQALERIRTMRKPLPSGWKFDRTEVSER